MKELPYFLKLIKQNFILYTVMTTGSLSGIDLEVLEHYWVTDFSVEIKNFPLSEEEVFDTILIFVQEGKFGFRVMGKVERFFHESATYFGEDTFITSDKPLNSFGYVRFWQRKYFVFKDFEKPLRVSIRSSPSHNYSLWIEPYIKSQNFNVIEDGSIELLLESYEVICQEYRKKLDINHERACIKINQLLLKTFDAFKKRNALGELKVFLNHDHIDVRRWAASHYLLVDEKVALHHLKEIVALGGSNGELAQETINGWQTQTLDFIY